MLGATTRIGFQKVDLRGEKTVKCAAGCGRSVKRAKTFYQTQSPFNQKSRDQIFQELRAERQTWLNEPETCKECKTGVQG